MLRATLLAVAASLSLATLVPVTAHADAGQQQACAGDVSEMQGIPMSEVRVAHTRGSESGVTEVILEYPGGSARCMVDREFNILDIRWNHHRGVSHRNAAKADMRGQEQACAAYFAQQMSSDMSAVRVKSAKPSKHGHASVVVSVPGMDGRCNVDAHYNVVGFKFLGAN